MSGSQPKIPDAVCMRFVVLLSVWSFALCAQSSTGGTVTGQVVDPQSAAVSGAEVRLVDASTNTSFATITNDEGRYVLAQVAPGRYSIVFSKQGFSNLQVSAQEVLVGQALTVDAKLQLGTSTTTMEVNAEAGAALQVLNATVGNTLSGQSLLLLPNLSRDVQTFSVLQPGVNPSGFAAGSPYDQNTYQLDGGNVTDDLAGFLRGIAVSAA